MSFNILFKFEIDNEKSGIVIIQCLTLIDNIESFWPIKNPIKSEAWLYVIMMEFPVQVYETRFINEIYGMSLYSTKTARERKLMNS